MARTELPAMAVVVAVVVVVAQRIVTRRDLLEVVVVRGDALEPRRPQAQEAGDPSASS
jgi:hypothetical protein